MTNDLMNRYNDLFDHMGDWLDKLDSHAFRNILQSDVAEDEHEYTVKVDVPAALARAPMPVVEPSNRLDPLNSALLTALAIWLPIKDLETFDAFLRGMETVTSDLLVAELRLRAHRH